VSQALFVSFEGPEGAGKSTQVQRLAAGVRALGRQVVVTREPGGTPLGELVRDLVLNTPGVAFSPRAEVLLFCAARAQLVQDVIRPALAAGRVVLVDRFADSTRAYQGRGRGLDSQGLTGVLSFATDGLSPDLTFLLDLPVEAGLARKRGTAGEWNRLDQESLAYHEAVRRGFLALAEEEPGRWRVLDARRPRDELAVEVLDTVRERLGLSTG
jgi:dTMP kinase